MSEGEGRPNLDAQTASDGAPPATPQHPSIPGIVRAFLRGDLSRIEPRLPEWLELLSSVGAGECWHKKSRSALSPPSGLLSRPLHAPLALPALPQPEPSETSFKAHLYEVYKICKIWGQDENVCKCALFHSAYSNSYVNLAIFKESTDRTRLTEIVGTSAEELIHTFCVVPRHDLIYNDLLARAPSAEELASLAATAGDGMAAAAAATAATASMRRLVPPEGVVVKHIKTGEPLTVDRLTVAQFVVMTMADFCEQLFSWQDAMFENGDGRLLYAGANHGSLWPGACKPGLWHSALSRMGALLRFALTGPDGRPLVPLPPVFEKCTQVLTEADQLVARDSYWAAVTEHTEPAQHDEALRLLRTACWHNPHVAEPHVLLAQIYCQRGQWGDAASHARRAVDLLSEWSTAWDKRMPWEAWMAMARVLTHGSATHVWPTTPFGMLNLGLVSDLDEPYELDEQRGELRGGDGL